MLLNLYTFYFYKDTYKVIIPILTRDPIHRMGIAEFR